ncbi:hypothetical protein [Dehalobacter sp. 14DCB1]|uniref:hypothetical protein n=1 Tax=Dehalobacter sp. 14DCB1 TaxID=2070227 RepID=UPI001047DEDE|nr:hypothetical protein [Dehalobacter sp. 14DCB1]TCX53631.1 hypothetical protein C1I36_02510 [Dehalobacter sp. 14DCB1]
MPDSRPNANIWGNVITCGEIAIGVYEIVGEHKKGIMMPKKMAEEILSESVLEMAEKDGTNLCFTDELSASMVANELIEQGIVTDPIFIAKQEALKQLDDAEIDTGFESFDEIGFELEIER